MTFSIVIPAYNGEKYIYEAIKSARRQERGADEIIVFDDGSTDKTIDIINLEEFRGIIKIYRNLSGPSGFVNAWNRSIELATGDYITILHQDDLLDSKYLKWIENSIRTFPGVKHFYSACKYIDEKGRIIRFGVEKESGQPEFIAGREYGKRYLRAALKFKHIHRCPGVTTHREVFKIFRYREEAGHIADDDFFLRVGKHTDVVGIPICLASYREHKGSETGRLSKVRLIERLARDYVFQSQFHSSLEYLDKDDVDLLNKTAARNISSLLRYGLSMKDREILEKAVKLRKELKPVYPGSFFRYIPPQEVIMWSMYKYFHLGGLDLLYTHILDIVGKIKRRIHGLMRC